MQARLSNIISNIESKLDGDGIYTVAIDGRCASGKTTLAAQLKEQLDCNVFHVDDFFLRPEQRTEQRLSTAGENIDHERFEEEVLKKLNNGETVLYRKYDCHTGTIEEAIEFPLKRINIVEGVYSMHPDLVPYYDFKIFLDVDRTVQRLRLIGRNSAEMLDRFINEWIPLEEMYFEELSIKDKADIVYEITEK